MKKAVLRKYLEYRDKKVELEKNLVTEETKIKSVKPRKKKSDK